MYVTRPLSMYQKDPSAISLAPPEGPSSGILVIADEESEGSCCFGLAKGCCLGDLPFPQNKNLKVVSVQNAGESVIVYQDPVVFVPVLDQPLSSNLYYAIKPKGKNQGEAFTCSTDENRATFCFCSCVRDVKPKPLDPRDTYQHFKICPKKRAHFTAKSTVSDGHPPHFLRRRSWKVYFSTPKNLILQNDAFGINTALRSQLPDSNFPVIANHSSTPVLVGKWYCPFMFIKEGITTKDQVKNSMFYEMTLEQKWEQIFYYKNEEDAKTSKKSKSVVVVDVEVAREVGLVSGLREVDDYSERSVGECDGDGDGVKWYKSGEGGVKVGLDVAIVERMKWEVERGGWVGGDGRKVRVEKEEVFEGKGGWVRFGCYVLVQSFVLKRIDGTLVFTYDFKNVHQITTKWE